VKDRHVFGLSPFTGGSTVLYSENPESLSHLHLIR